MMVNHSNKGVEPDDIKRHAGLSYWIANSLKRTYSASIAYSTNMIV